MPRKRQYDDNIRRLKKQESNNKPENKEKRRINSLKYYERKKLHKYMENNNGSSEGFIFKYIEEPTQIFITPISVDGIDLLQEISENSSIHTNDIENISDFIETQNLIYSDDSD
jgi:hypothetical protein